MRLTLFLLLWILFTPLTAEGQHLRISRADEELRADPAGTIIATIDEGTEIIAGEIREDWREVTIEGWIWAPSIRPDERPGFDLVVSARGGENLRATPNGERVARLRQGALLVEMSREGNWVQVQRKGWILGAASDEPGAAQAEPSTEPGPVAASPAAASPVAADGRLWTSQAGAQLLGSPGDGDTLGTIRPLAAIEVLESDGDWKRVRVEGWVPARALSTSADTGSIIAGLAPEVLRSNPDRFQGRVLEWEIQFIALDQAEKIRTDFAEGELFILARPPGDQPGFVYIAVPEELAEQVRTLTPLQRVTLIGRVRTGRSHQLAAPILDLIELR